MIYVKARLDWTIYPASSRSTTDRMMLRTIRLELARCPDFPMGSATHGYEFSAPLDEAGQFDPAEWRGLRARCTVRRFWGPQQVEDGKLLHSGRNWYFSYQDDREDDDEPIFKFDRHRFVAGEYVSITEHDGIERPFRVVSVR